jgi:hypothetical protein
MISKTSLRRRKFELLTGGVRERCSSRENLIRLEEIGLTVALVELPVELSQVQPISVATKAAISIPYF